MKTKTRVVASLRLPDLPAAAMAATRLPESVTACASATRELARSLLIRFDIRSNFNLALNS